MLIALCDNLNEQLRGSTASRAIIVSLTQTHNVTRRHRNRTKRMDHIIKLIQDNGYTLIVRTLTDI